MTTTGRIYDLSLLWKQAAAIFPCFDLHPLDWDAAYRDYLPKVLSAGDGQDFHLLLAKLLQPVGVAADFSQISFVKTCKYPDRNREIILLQ